MSLPGAGLVWLLACLPLALLFTSHISLLAILPSNSPPILQFIHLHATPPTQSLTHNPTSISFLARPRLGLVISGVTRFCPSRLPAARLPAYTRLGHCYYSTRPPHPRAPWPYAFTSTVMSSSDDDQPLGKGTSRACFHFICLCLGDAALLSVVSLLFD